MRILKKILVWILTIESRLIIGKYKPFIVAITGSVGKTSTKDAIYCVLKNRERYARKSDKSMNSEIGLPLTIIGAPNAWHSFSGWLRNIMLGAKMIINRVDYPNCLILEIGADHPGDIRKVARWLHPDIVVITRISKTPVHVEFFKSSEEVFKEKAFLARVVKDGGTLILFADDDKVMTLGEIPKVLNATKNMKDKKIEVLTFGIDMPATARGENYMGSIQSGISFTLDLADEKVPVSTHGVLGKVYLYSLLAAAVVGKVRNIPLADIVKSLNGYEAPRGRMNIIPGINGSMLIDDTYNSSPDAVMSALETLKELKSEVTSNAIKEDFGLVNLSNIPIGQVSHRKIAVLGDMMELGRFSTDEHRKIGREAAGIVNILITVGPRAQMIAEEALRSGIPADYVKCFDSSSDAAPYVASIAGAGDIILVKGSQSPRLERVTKALLREPEKADKLLVRQEEEWLNKK